MCVSVCMCCGGWGGDQVVPVASVNVMILTGGEQRATFLRIAFSYADGRSSSPGSIGMHYARGLRHVWCMLLIIAVWWLWRGAHLH